MKKALFIAWLALVHACMLQAQGVNVFDESSIGMGDSIDKRSIKSFTTSAMYTATIIISKAPTLTALQSKCCCK